MTKLSKAEAEIAKVHLLSRPKLVARWENIYGSAPPKGIKRGLMERAVVWHIQAQYFGAQAPATTEKLVVIGSSQNSFGDREQGADHTGKNTTLLPTKIMPGTRFMREWRGKTHVVDVTLGGFRYESQTYTSLSAVARKITGAHWSGPRFFGI